MSNKYREFAARMTTSQVLELIAQRDRLLTIRHAAKRLLVCFPETIQPGRENFNIPALIVEELRTALEQEDG